MANLEWTEGEGSDASTMSLGSPRPNPANRFFDVVPNYIPIGPRKVAMDRTIHTFLFREDYTVGLTIRHLNPDQWEDAQALKRHLMNGGTVTINTDDLDSNVYEGVQLAPGTEPEIANDDDERQLFSFAVVLADDSEMTINYDG